MPVETSPAVVLTDIEGTTTPIRFVHDRLFPYAIERLPAFLAAHAGDPEVAGALAEVARLAPGEDPLAALLAWARADAKVTPLKTLQGLIWREGYAAGRLKGEVYPDVPPALRAWRDAGLRLAVYSSGSVAAQKDIFGHSQAGDLASLFEAHFDTTIGGKREAESYQRIANALGVEPPRVLFLSDVAQELDAAAASGMHTCQLVRPEDGTIAAANHRTARDFGELGLNLHHML